MKIVITTIQLSCDDPRHDAHWPLRGRFSATSEGAACVAARNEGWQLREAHEIKVRCPFCVDKFGARLEPPLTVGTTPK